MGGVFANAYTLSSTPHNVVYLAKDDFVEQHELKEARTLGTKVLFSSLLRADQYKENKIYHLIFNSCINELNRALYAGSQAYPLKDLGISSSDFNPYTFIEKLMPLFSETPVPSLNYEFGSPIKEKFINPEVLKLMPLVQSNEFDTALQSFALEASVLTYKDLNDIRLVLIELKKAQAANNISKIDLSSAEGLAVTLASSGYKLPEKSIKVLLTLLKNPDFMKAIQLLIQKGTVNLEKFVPALN